MTQEEVDKINDYYNENPIEVNLDMVYDLNGTLDTRIKHKTLHYYDDLFRRIPNIPRKVRQEYLLALEYYEREEHSMRFLKKIIPP